MEKFSILLVDDVQQNIYSLKMMIEDNFDLNIYTALSAQDAMPLLMDYNIDLILSDIQMPDIDGFEFLEYLKGIEKTKDIPVIFITGIFNKSEYKQKGYSLGAIEYISKPIDDDLLSAKLRVYIDIYESQKIKDEEINKKNELLIHQSKLATMGEMIGVIAHQLKQPLNVISLYCSDIKLSYSCNELDDKFVNEFNDTTKEQISFMNNTIDDFINFFNPKKYKKEFLFKETFEKTLSLLQKQLENNNITINAHISDEKIYGVETELRQVLINLFTNSRDAFMSSEIKNKEININCITKNSQTIIMFEDNAGGVKAEDFDKIFDPYFTTKETGSGIGLYMVKLVIQTSFQGELKIQNTSNGIKFIIILNNRSPS